MPEACNCALNWSIGMVGAEANSFKFSVVYISF